MKIVGLLSGLTLLFTSCDLGPKAVVDPLTVKVTVAWKAVGGGDANQDMTLDNGVIYWADNVLGIAGANEAKSGRALWISDQIGATDTNPLVTDRAVYVQSEWSWQVPTKVFALDKITGHLLSTITLPSEDYRTRMFTWVSIPGRMVWHAPGLGVVSMVESSIDLTKATQNLTPQTIFPGVYDKMSPPFLYDGKLYFQVRKSADTYTDKSDGDDIIVMDATDYSIRKRIVTDYSLGNFGISMAAYNNKIFYQDWNALRGIDPATDTQFFSLPKDVDHSSGKGLACFNDKVYFSSSNSAGQYNKNLTCRSALDGHLVWAVAADSIYSLGNRPVVKNGIVYLLTPTGFKLFNAETGVLLGKDDSLNAGANDLVELTLEDSDTMYFRAKGSICAVKLDWKLDAQGKLTR